MDHLKILLLAAVGTVVGWAIARLTGFETAATGLWRSGGTFVVFYAVFVLTVGRRETGWRAPAMAVAGLVLVAAVLGFLYAILSGA
ncbi:MAG: hypothetical protein WAN34_05970 [Acidimicrobiia bacterium]